MTPAQKRQLRRGLLVELLEDRAMMTGVPHELRVRPEWFGVVDQAETAQSRLNLAQPAAGQFWNVQLNYAQTAQLARVADVQPLLGEAPFRYTLVRGLGEVGQVQLRTWADPATVRDWLSSHGLVQSFSVDAQVSVERLPNDQYFYLMYGLENTGQSGGTVDADIDAAAAWDRTTGSSSTVVAIIDTGIEYTHPDLAPNIWVNPGEIAGDGIDNDANGFVDDVHGVDFYNGDGDPMDDQYHGTHVAGTIGAKGNNSIGVVGVNWDAQLMAVKFLNSQGSGFTSDAVLSVNYVTMMRERGTNVRVINASFGGGGYDGSMASAITRFGDVGGLFVAAAGNDAANVDVSPAYPAAYGLPNMLSVAATGRNDTLASFSNYGANSIDLAAPGVSIASTITGNSYAYLNGTSMAAPHVAGAAALAFSEFPDSTYAEIRQALRASVDVKSSLTGLTSTGGRLNVHNALNYLAANAPATPSIYLNQASSYQALDLTPGGSVTTLLSSSSGTSTAALNLGANTFRFYGTQYSGASSLHVSENGLISFGSINSSGSNNNLVSSPAQPTIAPYWDDLTLSAANSGAVLAKFEDTDADGTADRLIIEWSNVSQATAGASNPGTFQAILELNTGSADGQITFNYPDLNFGLATVNRGASATIGISAGSTSGKREVISYNNGTNSLIDSTTALRLDRTRPIAEFSAITPNTRTTPLSSATLTFTEPIQESMFTKSDLSLTFNGTPIVLGSDVAISSLGNNQYEITGLTNDTSLSGEFTLSVNNAGLRDLLGHYGNGTSSVTWQQALPALPVRLLSVTSNGGASLSVSYEVLAAGVSGMLLSTILSADITPDSGDTQVSAVFIQNAADLSLGIHTKTFTIGTGSGHIPLPGTSATDSSADYKILVTADSTFSLGGTPPENAADLTATFVGAYNPGAGIIYVHGSPAADTIGIDASLNISIGATNYSFSTAGITQIRVRAHDGNDTVNATTATLPIFVLGGSGNDTISTGSAADTLDGGSSDNSLSAGAGDDTLISRSGNDAMYGGDGNDTYAFDHDGSLGSDSITDSAGTDLIDLSSTTTTGISLDLSLTTVQTPSSNQTLTITAETVLENITGTSLADQLTGNSASNVLLGRQGNDILMGLGGNDSLDGGEGNDQYRFDTDVALGVDSIQDSSGTDTLDFSSTSTKNIECSLWATASQVINSSLSLTIPSATSIENLIGGDLNDVLWGNSLQNSIEGRSGNDTLRSSRGSDSLDGGTGDDVYLMDWDIPTDAVLGSQGTITIVDSSGTDTIDFSGVTTLGATINLALTSSQVINTNLSLVLPASDAIENVVGSGLSDQFSGSSANNLFRGGGGNDTYRFDVDEPSGSDTIDESGGGIDLLDFSTTTASGITVDLSQPAAQTVHANLTLTLSSATTIENLTGGSLADTLSGNSLANTITGNSGDDVLTGAGNDDTLIGGLGNDRYVFNTDTALGVDTLNESAGGIDSIDFSSSTSLNVTINLGLATAQAVNANLSLALGSATTFEHAWGGAQNDVLIGNANANSLLGFGGNDTLTGLAGNDTLDGGEGDDVYTFNTNSALGTDTLGDSSGTDLLDFSTSTTLGVAINLSTATSQVVNTGLSLILGSATAFENVYATSMADIITGNGANNYLRGGAGNDSYRFNANTAQGADTIDEAGGGVDTIDFTTTTTAGVTVDLGIGEAQTINSNLTLVLGTGTHFENLLGGSLNDTLTGNSNANTITGNAGNDTINGGAANDTLVGSAGNDTYLFDADTALGTDTINEAGGGTDLLDFSSTTTLAVTVNLGLATTQVINANLSLVLGSATTMENVTGTALDDNLLGNASANILSGGDGADILIGLAGNDTLNGGNGNDIYRFTTSSALGTDTLVDASGVDLLDFSQSTTLGASVNLALATSQAVNSNLSLILGSATAFENIDGTSLNDTFTANGANNLLRGGAGNDSYRFNANTALGTDTIDESVGGVDTIDFTTTTTAAVTVNLSLNDAQIVNANLTLVLGSGENFENLLGGSVADTLIGNANANTITGNAGNDTITGGAGNDILIGSAGNDIYLFDADASLGTDTINEAGGGTDQLNFSSTTTLGVNVDLGIATVQTVNANLSLILSSASTIENVTGTSLADILRGNSLINAIVASDGDDLLQGLGGNDSLNGGNGNDTYVFTTTAALGTDTLTDSAGSDLLDFSASSTLGSTVNLGQTTSQVVNSNLSLILTSATAFENINGSSLNDFFTGNSASNVLRGGAGNDTYRFNAGTAQGSDTIDESGGGIDTLDFTTTTAVAVNVDLSLSGSQTVHGNLTLNLGSGTNLENLIGGSQSDTLAGNANNNLIDGNSGNDTITAGDGDDTLIGNAGNDTLSGGNGNDVYQLKASVALGTDTLTEAANGGQDLLDFSSSTSAVVVDLGSTVLQTVNTNLKLTLSSDVNFEFLVGSSGNDTLNGNAANNVILGGAGNDTINGRDGADVLVGGSGADLMSGGNQSDLIVASLFSYFNETTRVVNWNSVLAVQAEWQRTDLDYVGRVANLRSGGGLNGSVIVDNTVALDDAAVDSVLGQADQDWFWLFGSDSASDLNQGGAELVN